MLFAAMTVLFLIFNNISDLIDDHQTLSEHTIRDAEYELDAALKQYFYHPNTGPFLAVRLAQRFPKSRDHESRTVVAILGA